MPSMVMRSPSPKTTRCTGFSLSSGQFARNSNRRGCPRDSEMMVMSLNFPWNKLSSSECQPTDA
eukprot:CAMPEP_0176312526 /NCGR_PEP_ID=MMETSP0121_2-20121125/66711_1 /TAXON_ID=160619 /ORGANISM="Kryptoperidinium foliaceum, Strain CCMP 1326" /LENGTH=63 /DNA_ID=CAMNT_0017654605 /DNA_START=185 /DNA_END=373 /DNA_ORIENTATION=+